MDIKFRIIILLGVLTLLTGCKDNLPGELAGLADQKSLDRYAALPADSDLLLCLQAESTLGKLPKLGPEGQQLGHFGPSTLVKVNREMVPALAEVEGLQSLVLWGDGQAAKKLDPQLRSTLLKEMAQPQWREKSYAIIGTFDKDSAGLKEALVAVGAQPRSVKAGLATFDATSEVIFDILAWDHLRQLKEPTLMRPTQSLK